MPPEVVTALIALVGAVLGWLVPAPYARPLDDLLREYLRGLYGGHHSAAPPTNLAAVLKTHAKQGRMSERLASYVLSLPPAKLEAVSRRLIS